MTERKILTQDEIWPPCGACGSDGFPADFGADKPEDYRCYDCNPEFYAKVFWNRPDRYEEAMRRHVEQKDEVMGFREDPTCFSYRGFGPIEAKA